jgi:hypothetical protein
MKVWASLQAKRPADSLPALQVQQNARVLEMNSFRFCISLVWLFLLLISWGGSRDSVVGIATGYGLGDRGVTVRVHVGLRIFFFPRRVDRLWGPPSLLLFNRYRGSSPVGKAAGA